MPPSVPQIEPDFLYAPEANDPSPAAEPDCIHWLDEEFYSEPEAVQCIRHGLELPCPKCQPETPKETV